MSPTHVSASLYLRILCKIHVSGSSISIFISQDPLKLHVSRLLSHLCISGPSTGSMSSDSFFFLRLPTGQYGPVSQLSRSEERCTGPFNWSEAHCAGEKVKRKIGPFQWKSLWIKPNSKTTKGRGPPRQPGTPRPGSQVHGPKRKTTTTSKRLHKQILERLDVLDLQWTVL